ncbi:MAG TPA: YdcH family protein [Vicinamibacterales bacterium]|nr:YdcH family protein [Vicinamibacterales bacterium]
MGEIQLSERDDVKQGLLQTSENFRQLVSEHQALDEQIRHLSAQAFLTDEQQFQEVSLKKRKLALKDQIEAMVRSRRDRAVSAQPGH